MRVIVGLAVVLGVGCGRVGFDAESFEPAAERDLDLTDCSNLPADLAFTRASPAMSFGSDGVLRTAAADTPRCAFDPSGSPLGLLLEGARTNFVREGAGLGTDTDGLPNNWHSQHGGAVTVSAVVTESTTFTGFREAALTVQSTAREFYQVMLDVEVPSGGDYAFSWFVRSPDSSGITGCTLFASFWTPGFGEQLGESDRVETPVPDDQWSRASLQIEAPSGTGEIQAFWSCNIDANSEYTAILAAPQVEAGFGATSPIFTDGEAVTRAPDVAIIAGSDWLGTSAGAIAIDASIADRSSTDPRTLLAATASPATKVLEFAAPNYTARFGDRDEQLTAPGSIGAVQVAYRWGADSTALAVNGEVRVGPGFELPAAPLQLRVGDAVDGGAPLGGSISRLRLWPESLTDSELESATR